MIQKYITLRKLESGLTIHVMNVIVTGYQVEYLHYRGGAYSAKVIPTQLR